MSTTTLEWSKVQIGEEFINAICKAKEAAINEINMIVPCLLERDDKQKADDIDRMLCNLDHSMHILDKYIHIKHHAEHETVDDATVEKIVTKAMMKMEERTRMKECEMYAHQVKEAHAHPHEGSIG